MIFVSADTALPAQTLLGCSSVGKTALSSGTVHADSQIGSALQNHVLLSLPFVFLH